MEAVEAMCGSDVADDLSIFDTDTAQGAAVCRAYREATQAVSDSTAGRNVHRRLKRMLRAVERLPRVTALYDVDTAVRDPRSLSSRRTQTWECKLGEVRRRAEAHPWWGGSRRIARPARGSRLVRRRSGPSLWPSRAPSTRRNPAWWSGCWTSGASISRPPSCGTRCTPCPTTRAAGGRCRRRGTPCQPTATRQGAGRGSISGVGSKKAAAGRCWWAPWSGSSSARW
mmetsp:Transcript_25019/g.64472  ORF Transcript_25019/g.64472 Transcript_25019/m.64472 type:complete len:227 (+) Transcript_25019:1662-2342(+)